MTALVAKVYVEHLVYEIDQPFDYLVPPSLAGGLVRGCRVMVPFGGGNRTRQGMVVEVLAVDTLRDGIKEILSTLDQTPLFTPELFGLADYLVAHTFCTFYDAVRTILPTAISHQAHHVYRLVQLPSEVEETLTDSQRAFVTWLNRPKSQKQMDAFLADQPDERAVRDLLTRGLSAGWVVCEEQIKRRVLEQTEQIILLSDDVEDRMASYKATPKQREILQFLAELDGVSGVTKKELLYCCGVGEGVLNTLLKRGLLQKEWRKIEPTLLPEQTAECCQKPADVVLSPAQQAVFTGILEMINADQAGCALLHGVTGSGKTKVFLKLIEQVLQKGQQAMMLVPEIALTPQMVAEFRQQFGERVAVTHSHLSLGERLREYQRVQAGVASIVVGTRSAVFLPFANLGLIIMDEEGESSYQSSRTPRYHAREIAKRRAVYHNALLLLSSATPSLESFYRAKRGNYRLFSLTERYADLPLPAVYLVDMRAEQQLLGAVHLSSVVRQELHQNLLHHEQSILFLNRRGYHTVIQCIGCGKPVCCPHCDTALTYHRANDYLMCHTCGYANRRKPLCEHCNSSHWKQSGLGTQKVEDEIRTLYPTARVLRMDADTTYSRYAYEEKFAAFQRGEYDILIGTQMVAKGLNFPNVTLVCVLNADAGLYAPDYRGAERVFSLITQVVGRSGRVHKEGRAYIQTDQPDHPVLLFAAKQDYLGFYEDEIATRKMLKYPPFFDLCTVTLVGKDADRVERAAQFFALLMKQTAASDQHQVSFEAMGPFPAVVHKIADQYRQKIFVKCHLKQAMQSYFSACLKGSRRKKEMRGIGVTIDVNGDSNA